MLSVAILVPYHSLTGLVSPYRFLIKLAASNSKGKPGKEIKLSRERLKHTVNNQSKYERTSLQIKDLLKNQRLPLMVAVHEASRFLCLSFHHCRCHLFT